MSKNTNLSFLTDFLTADIVNSRVGMNNVSPQSTFDVTGTGKFSGILTLGSTISNGTYTYTLPSATGTLALVGGSGVGTVTSVAAITLGTSGTDLTSTVANGTTTPVITLNVPDASVTARGVITTGTQYIAGLKIFTSTIVANVDLQLPAAGTASTTFIKNISGSGLTSIGSNGFGFNNSDNIYFSGSNKAGGVFAFNNTGNRTYTLQDASGTLAFTSEIPTNAVGGTGTLNTIPKFTAATTIGNSNIFDSGSIIYNTNPAAGTFAWQFNGSTVTGQSYGAQVIAGTNASDIGFKVMNAAASINYLVVRGDGLVTLTGALNGTSASFTGNVVSTLGFLQFANNYGIEGRNAANTAYRTVLKLNSSNQIEIGRDTDISAIILGTASANNALTLASTGAATFSSTIRSDATNGFSIGSVAGHRRIQYVSANTTFSLLNDSNALANFEAAAATFSSSVTATSLGVGNNTSGFGDIMLLSNTNTNVYPRVNRSSTSYEAGWKLSTGGTDSWYLGLRSADGVGSYHFYSYTTNSSVVSITNGGNVLIGTTTDGGRKLEVQTSSTNAGLWVQTGGTTSAYTIADFRTGTNLPALQILGTGAATFGASADVGGLNLSSTYASKLGLYNPSGSANMELGNNVNTNGSIVSRLTSYNVSNGNTGNESSTNFIGVASIETQLVSTSGNASGTSGANILFLTKADGGTLTERMRITSDGNIRYTSNNASAASFDLNYRFSTPDSARIRFSTTTSFNLNEPGELSFWTRANDAQGGGNITERMRITSEGFLKAKGNETTYSNLAGPYHELRTGTAADWTVFVSNASGNPYGLRVNYPSVTPNNSDNWLIYCDDLSSVRFRVASNGNVQNQNNSYGAISDIKLKENIEDATPKLDDLMKVKVRNYNLIGDDKKQIGVIAQELEEVFPAMIDESEDFEEVEIPQVDEEGNEVVNEEGEVVTTKERVSKGTSTKSVKYSVFVPMLIKAIQEQQVQIDKLKNS